MNDILDKIDKDYKTFSPSQKKIAEYLTHNLTDAILLNSNQIANEANVSEATVTRFITKLGFSGFAEFKRVAGHQVLSGYTTVKLAESAGAFSKTSAFSKIIEADIANINKMAVNLPEKLFNAAVKKLSDAHSIYVLGLRSSHSLAVYLAFNLRFFLNTVKIIQPGIEDIPEQVMNIGKKDLLVVISFKRYTRRSLQIAERIKKRGVYVIAITGSNLSPIGQLADTVLVVDTEIPTYLQSFTAAMSLINALITAVAIKKKTKALPALDHLEKEFIEFNTFIE